MSFGINNLKELKAKNQLNILLQNFITQYIENNKKSLTDIIQFLDFSCKQNKEKDAYNVFAKVNVSRFYSLPTVTYKMLVADTLCFISENNGEPKDVSKAWQSYCKAEISGESNNNNAKNKALSVKR